MALSTKERVYGASQGLLVGEALGRMAYVGPKEYMEHFLLTGKAAMSFDYRDLWGARQVLDYYRAYRENTDEAISCFANNYLKNPYGDTMDGLLIVAQQLINCLSPVQMLEWEKTAEKSGIYSKSITYDFLIIRCLGISIVSPDEDRLKQECEKMIRLCTADKWVSENVLFYAHLMFQAVNTGTLDAVKAIEFSGNYYSMLNTSRCNLIMDTLVGNVFKATSPLPVYFLTDLQHTLLEKGLELTRGEQAFIVGCFGAILGEGWFTKDYYGASEVMNIFNGITSFMKGFQEEAWATKTV